MGVSIRVQVIICGATDNVERIERTEFVIARSTG